MAKSKSASLVLRNLSANLSPSLDPGASHNAVNQGLDRNSVSQALGDRCGTESKTQHYVLKSGKEGNRCGRKVSVQTPGNRCAESRTNLQNLQTSDSRHIEKVFTNVRQKVNRPEDDQKVLDQRVNVSKWGFVMSTPKKAAIHLGENCNDNLLAYGTTNFDALKTFFDITQKLILHPNPEIFHD